jgi:hypothetical protein
MRVKLLSTLALTAIIQTQAAFAQAVKNSRTPYPTLSEMIVGAETRLKQFNDTRNNRVVGAGKRLKNFRNNRAKFGITKDEANLLDRNISCLKGYQLSLGATGDSEEAIHFSYTGDGAKKRFLNSAPHGNKGTRAYVIATVCYLRNKFPGEIFDYE